MFQSHYQGGVQSVGKQWPQTLTSMGIALLPIRDRLHLHRRRAA